MLSLLKLVCPLLDVAEEGQLPATLAVFAAEAASLLRHPKHPMAKILLKLLVKKRELRLEVRPIKPLGPSLRGFGQHCRYWDPITKIHLRLIVKKQEPQ